MDAVRPRDVPAWHRGWMPTSPRPLPESLGAAFSRAEALAAGVSPRRVRASDIEHVFHGALLHALPTATPITADGPLAIDERKRARVVDRARSYASVMGAHMSFAGMTAAALLGAPLPDDFDPEHDRCVSALAPHRAPRARGIRGLQTRPALTTIVTVDGVRITSPASTWAHVASTLSERWLVILGDFLVRVPRDERGHPRRERQLTTVDHLRAAAWAPGRRGRHVLLQALEHIRVGSASRLETEYRLDAAAAGLPEPELDVEIRTATGRLLGIVDAAHAVYGVLIEIEGDHHRTSRAQWERDITRHAAFVAEGYEVMRVTGRHVRSGAAPRIVADALRRHGWTG